MATRKSVMMIILSNFADRFMACQRATLSAQRTETADVLSNEYRDSKFEQTPHPEFTSSTEVSLARIGKPKASHLCTSPSQREARLVLSFEASSRYGFKTVKLLKMLGVLSTTVFSIIVCNLLKTSVEQLEVAQLLLMRDQSREKEFHLPPAVFFWRRAKALARAETT